MTEYIFYYWFKGEENFPEMFSEYLGDVGDIAPNGKVIVDWTYEKTFAIKRKGVTVS